MLRAKFLMFILIIFIFSSFGCESLRKKFTRPPKNKPQEEEMVVFPKDYSKQELPSNEAYMLYYTYWKAWHIELLNSIGEGSSKKKIISCLEQVNINLGRMKDLLAKQEKKKLLENYMSEISSLQQEIASKSIAMISMSRLRSQSEQLLRNIQRDFTFSKIKDGLK